MTEKALIPLIASYYVNTRYRFFFNFPFFIETKSAASLKFIFSYIDRMRHPDGGKY